jgi:hypothetical protein
MLRIIEQPLLRRHVTHTHLIWDDAASELARSGRWSEYTVSQMVGECTMLEINHVVLGLQQRSPLTGDTTPQVSGPRGSGAATPRGYATELPPSPSRRPVSLQEIVATSVALKAGRDLDMSDDASETLKRVSSSGSTVRLKLSASPLSSSVRELPAQDYIPQMIAELQREVLLLRNEQNLELWLNRENVIHIGRLHEERVLSRSAEAERQALVCFFSGQYSRALAEPTW